MEKTMNRIRLDNLLQLVKQFDSDKDFAEKAGIATGYLSQLKMGGKPIGDGRNIGEKAARKMEVALGLDFGFFDTPQTGKENNHYPFKQKVAESNTEYAEQSRSFVPIISWVQAGEFDEAIDLFAPGYSEEQVARINGGDRVYALYVRGDSMTSPPGVSPSFPEGYIIHVDPDQTASNGDCVIAKVAGQDSVTFKQLKIDDQPYLKPLNPIHPSIFEEFTVLGKVIGASIKL